MSEHGLRRLKTVHEGTGMESRFRKSGVATLVGAAMVSLALAGCGGGGSSGGGGGGGSTDSDTTTDPVGSSSSSIRLSGTVVSGGSSDDTADGGAVALWGEAHTAEATASRDLSASPLEGVSIHVRLFKDGERMTDDDGEPVTLSTSTDEDGRLSLSVPGDFEDADRAVVEFRHEGYVLSTRTFRNPSETLTIDKALAPENIGVEKTGTEGVRFAIDVDGNVHTGTDIDGLTQADIKAEMTIPSDQIETDVDAVIAGLAYFNPANDTGNFPGDFKGTGDYTSTSGVSLSPDAGTDAYEEYSIVPTAFAQLSLRDQDGERLTLTGSESANPEVHLRIEDAMRETITEDHDESTDEVVDTPIYLYRDDEWVFAGLAQLQKNDGNGYEDVKDVENLPTNLYARLEFDEDLANEWRGWTSISQPGDDKKSCVASQLAYEGSDNSTIPYSGYLELDLPGGGKQWLYVNNGELAESVSGDANGGWSAQVWNRRAFQYADLSKGSGLTVTDITSGGECTVPDTVSHTLSNPYTCSISGQVKRGDADVVGRTVVATDNKRFWDFSVTDDNGEYAMDVRCGTLTVRVGDASKAVTVDDGEREVDPIELANQRPELRLSLPDDATKDEQAALDLTVWDPDGDELDEVSVSLDDSEIKSWTPGREYLSEGGILFTPSAVGDAKITLEATDANGASSTLERTLVVEEANRAPLISRVSAKVNGSTRTLNCGGTSRDLSCDHEVIKGNDATYTVHAYDPEGDAFTYNWDKGTSSESETALTGITTSQTVTADLKQDTATEASAAIDITAIDNKPPEVVYAYLDPFNTDVNSDGTNDEVIELRAYALTGVTGEEITEDGSSYSWTVKDGDGNEVTDAVTGAAGDVRTIEVGALQEGSYDVTVTIADTTDSTVTQTHTMSLGIGLSDAEVIIE